MREETEYVMEMTLLVLIFGAIYTANGTFIFWNNRPCTWIQIILHLDFWWTIDKLLKAPQAKNWKIKNNNTT